MANNLIQIKRSAVTATPPSLSAGELAYSNATGGSGVLFIGSTDGGTVVPIGGVRNPGVLTANQALVANSTSFLDTVKAANLLASAGLSLTNYVVNTFTSTANASVLGANVSGGGSNTEIPTTSAIVTYVAGKTGAAVGANGQFLFNNSGITTGASNFYYDYTSGALTIGNNSVNVQIGYVAGGGQQLQHWQGNANTYVQVQITNDNTGPSSSADYIVNSDNATDTTNFVDLGINGSGWSNTLWTINGANDGYLYAANGSMAIGTASAKAIQFFTGGTLSVNERMRVDAGGNVAIGTSTADALFKVAGTANVTGIARFSANVTIDGTTTHNGNVVISTSAGINANGGYGSAGQALFSNGSSIYWAAPPNTNTAAQYTWSNTQTFQNTITFSSNILVGTSVNAASHTVGSAFIANTTNIVFTGANVDATSATAAFKDVNVSGNLVVSGTVTTINTQQMTVLDPIIELGSNNGLATSDIVDIGWFGIANSGGTINYPGFGRIAASSSATNPFFRLFTSTSNPNVSTTFTTTSTGTLQAFLVPYGTGGAFVANSSNVSITANSTIGVNIVANSLSLSTALPATSGGTGQNTYATGDLLYASSTSALSKLSVAANGYVLQITNNLPAYGTLDGGTF